MSDPQELNCHPASSQEQIQAYQNVFPIWPHADTMEEHVARRLASSQHNRARWFVGCVGNRVVVSLGCYPMRFLVRNQPVEGMAIGAVHTIPECRGRGFAARLLTWVEQHQAKNGCELSLLFSDIPIKYYARLGYVACPALEGWLQVEEHKSAEPSHLKLLAFDPRNELSQLKTIHATHHQQLAISIDRDEGYWTYLIGKFPANRFYWVVDSSANRGGYVCLNAVGSSLRITDFAVAEEYHPQLSDAILDYALAGRFQQMGGWLPGTSAFGSSFRVNPRETEITMLKFLNEEKQIDPEMQRAGGGIHEIDHV